MENTGNDRKTKNMNVLIFIMFCALKVKDSKANSSETTTNLECETWKNEHIFLAQDVHFYNKTFAFVKIQIFTLF